jgi:hypothetical protein
MVLLIPCVLLTWQIYKLVTYYILICKQVRKYHFVRLYTYYNRENILGLLLLGFMVKYLDFKVLQEKSKRLFKT